MRIVGLICFTVFIIACSSNSVPSGVLPPDKMKPILFDLIRAEEYVTNVKTRDTAVDFHQEAMQVYEKVFRLHNTSRKEFYTSYEFYQEHPDKHKLLFDTLQNWGTRKREELNKLQKGKHEELIEQN